MLQVYTGEGKGKTSAAMGSALRFLGRGGKVMIVQFFKPGVSGEIKALGKFSPLVKLLRIRILHPFFSGDRKESVRTQIKKEWKKILSQIEKEEWGMLILDEINIALKDGFLKWEEVKPILNFLPEREIIFTGRGMISELEKAANLITEMVKIKHPYDNGVSAREGIEY